MKTLMHICCAPCANRPIAALREEGIELAGFWYNPNIHPYTEYRSRKTCLEDYAREISLPLVVVNDYGLRQFVQHVADNIDGPLRLLLSGADGGDRPLCRRARL